MFGKNMSNNQRIANLAPSPLVVENKNKRCCPMVSKFLGLIAIEPLVFLAIVALYIEFPSIQDLIYTKICLQVVSKHSNNSLYLPPSVFGSANGSGLLDDKSRLENIVRANGNLSSINTQIETSRPPSNGRIQDKNPGYEHYKLNGTIPSMQQRDHHVICDRLEKTNTPIEIRKEIASEDSLFWLKYQVLICGLCAISSPYWGGMSDKIGRLIPLNVPIVIAIFGNLISLAFGILISLNWHNAFHVDWLYLGGLLTGISGGQSVIMINSFGFISDNTSIESRSKRVAVLESVIFVAHSVGYYISRHVMSLGLASVKKPWFNRHFVAFSSIILLNLLAVLYAIVNLRHRKFHRFINNFEREHQETFGGDILTTTGGNSLGRLTESEANIVNQDRLRELTASTPDDLDGPIVKVDKNLTDFGVILTIRYYKETYETITKKRESRVIILLLLFCTFISAMSLVSLMSLLYLYLRADPFNWTTSRYSNYNSIGSLTRGLALIGLTLTKLFKVWEMSDPIVSALGFLSRGLGLLFIGMAQTTEIIDWSIIAFIPSEYTMPPIRSLLSKLVVKEEVGKLYSCMGAIQNISLLVGNIIFYLAYSSIEMHEFFRLSFLVVACSQFAAVLIMLIVYTILRHKIMIV